MCTDAKSLYDFLNNIEVKKKIHVNLETVYEMCSDPVNSNYTKEKPTYNYIVDLI